MSQDHHKVEAHHLQRKAYLYVRQSTLRQVLECTESTQRQYALQQRAIALGWKTEQVVVIDNDQGQSGASSADREGFQRLVSEVGLGHAGIVLGLEVSRLARNNSDWHRLLEICALTNTLILDEDGLYDPNLFNDRLILGLKGTMSEAELHVLRGRLRGGIVNKARRGELKQPLPVGLVYDAEDRVILDPDRQVQQALQTLFATFKRIGSACGTVRHFHDQKLLFPRRLGRGLRKGELVWGALAHSRTLQILHHPAYAGAFTFGRTRSCSSSNGKTSSRKLPQDQWHTLLLDHHPGYISWEQYLHNQRRLQENAQARGVDRRKSPPGEGSALLQGLVLCAVCGQRMTVRYHTRQSGVVPDYMCQRQGIERAQRICQNVPGAGVDSAVGELLLETMTPLALEMALTVQHELQSCLDQADQLRRQQVERARYEADLAEQRYRLVDPRNRLVADTLEADWNEKLRMLARCQEDYERQREADRLKIDEEDRAKVLALVRDFPRLWRDPKTPEQERKRIVRLLIEDITLLKKEQITVGIRLKGGTTHELTLPLPCPSWAIWKTSPEVLAEVDRLLEELTDGQVAESLNERGWSSGKGQQFSGRIVARLRREYGLKSRYERLREKGYLNQQEMAKKLGIHPSTLHDWRQGGLVRGYVYNDKNEYLYEPIGPNGPTKQQGVKLADRRCCLEVTPDEPKEVQDEV